MVSPFFSIVIPTYNSAQTLLAALESVVIQTFLDFEILIIDGLSNDATIHTARSLNDGRIKIYSDHDKGIYDAMNKGIDLAKGKWIYFMGSDDVLHDKQVLLDVSKMISKSRHDVIYGNVLVKGDNQWAIDGEVYGGKFRFNQLLKRNICHQSIFYRLEFIRANKLYFNLKYPISADWDINLQCWFLTRFQYIDRLIAIFSSSGVSSARSVTDPFWVERKIKYARYFQGRRKSFKSFIADLFKKLY